MTPEQERFYIREPIQRLTWRSECLMIDRLNASGAMPPIEKLTFEAWKAVDESDDSGQKMPPAHRVEPIAKVARSGRG